MEMTGEQATTLAELQEDIERLEERLSLRRYACADCGYSETYLTTPALLTDEEMAEQLVVSWDSSPNAGPYR